MDTTTTKTTETTMNRKQYRARVNAAAGTDIAILEKAYLDLYAQEDFANASRILGIIWSARAAAGLDPKTGNER